MQIGREEGVPRGRSGGGQKEAFGVKKWWLIDQGGRGGRVRHRKKKGADDSTNK